MAEQLRLLSGAKALQTDAIDLQQDANAWASSFKVFQQAASTVKTIDTLQEQEKAKQDKITNMTDAHTAKADASRFTQTVSNKTGTERRSDYENELSTITQAFEDGNISTGYFQGYMGVIENGYSTALGDQQAEFNNSVGDASGSEYMAGVKAGIAGPATIYIDNVARDTGVPKAVIRDGVLNGIYTSYTEEINNATSIEELNNITKEFNNIKSTNLDSTSLLKTRSKEQAAKLAQQESIIKNTTTAKIKQFKYDAGTRFSEAVGNVDNPLEQYNKTPEEVTKDLGILHSESKKEFNNALNTYKESYNEHEKARSFISSNSVYTTIDAGKVKENPTLKPIWEQEVQSNFINNYLTGNMSNVVSISNTQQAFLGETGNNMYSTFTSSNEPAVLKAFLEQDRLLRTTPGGVAAYNNIYSKEQRESIILTDIITSSIGFDDPVKARDMVYKAQASTAQVQLPKKVKLMQDKRRKELGNSYQDYRTTLDILNKLEGADVVTAEAKLVEFYQGRDIEKSGFIVDTKYGNPKVDPSIEDRFYERTKLLIESSNIDPDTVQLKTMPDGSMSVNDSTFDTPLFILDTNVISDNVLADLQATPTAGPLERRFRAGGERVVSTAAAVQGGIVAGTETALEGVKSETGQLTFGLITNAILGFVQYLKADDVNLKAESSSNNVVDDKYVIAKDIQDTNIDRMINAAANESITIQEELPPEIKKHKNVRNNNPGNIKVNKNNKWDGAKPQAGTFEQFNSPVKGIRATTKVVDKNIERADTFKDFVLSYASEKKEVAEFNKTGKLPGHLSNYANSLAKSLDLKANDKIPKSILKDNSEFKKFISALINQEGSGALAYYEPFLRTGIKEGRQ